MDVFGATRSSVQSDHALITPDSHVSAPLPGWENATGVEHISPTLGARFTQYTAQLESGALSGPPRNGVERFLFVSDGAVEVTIERQQPDGSFRQLAGLRRVYAYIPPSD